MSADVVAKWLFLSSLFIVVVLVLATKFESPRFVLASRRKRDTARARKVLAAPSPNVVVYWDKCRSLSRPEIVKLAKEYGKRYVDYEISEAGWALNFVNA